MLVKFTDIIDKLLVYPENMKKNLDITHGLLYSQPVLLALTKKGMKREDAYRIVQRNAMDVWKSKKNFMEMLKADPEVSAVLNESEVSEAFDPKKSLNNVDYIFKRVGLE
jgi:adenylosuccinate lyase